jgi:hypothetical protein
MNLSETSENKQNVLENVQVYKIIKCSLKSILKKPDIILPIIETTVKEINQFVIIGYQFIKLYLINKYDSKIELPTINKQFILDVLKTISTSETNRGKKKKEENIKNKDLKQDIKLFYDTTFSKIINTKLSITNKTHILEQTANEMLTCIKTNISTHFIEYLFKYINILFKYPKTNLIKQEKDKLKRKELYKQLNEEIRNLKSDLINNKIEDSKEEYHKWIKDNKKYLYPEKINKSVAYDVKIHPEKYISYSFYINSKIEELGKRCYQMIPQRNDIVPKNITINTPAIADLIDRKLNYFNYNKSELVLNAKKHQTHIWSKLLKLEKRSIFNHKDYIFYNQLSTDGFSCCLLFIHKKYKDKEYGDKIPEYIEDNTIRKLESLTKEECDKFLSKEYKIVSIDPGKLRPISMIDEQNNFYKYSACRRRYENYTKRSRTILENEKKKNNDIIKSETEISKFNSRTLKQEEYKKFITKKTEINEKIKNFYHKILFRKLAFRRFVKTKQSEAILLNDIKSKYLSALPQNNNKKLAIFIGDYGRATAMKGTISTPNIGFKKLLSKNFDVIEVNEYNTSKLYHKTLTELTNVRVKKGKHSKHLHEILTLKEETENRIFVNRDVNACKNILHLAKSYLTTQSRPIQFCRKPKDDKIIKKKIVKKQSKEIII